MKQYPQGKLNADDKGALTIAIGEQDNTIIISFGKKIAWIGMSKPEAIEFAKTIMRRAGIEETHWPTEAEYMEV